MNSVSITVVTGFLGSGKTTLINKIIEENRDKKFALIVNEFGEISIDAELVSQDVPEDQIMEINNGCICCVVRGDLINAVDKLLNSGREIDYIIIETSGLADPIPVAQTFEMEDFGGKTFLDSIITLVDGINYWENDKNYDISLKQILAADIMVLNKAQELTDDQISSVYDDIKSKNPEAFVLINRGDIDTRNLIETGKWTYERILKFKSTKSSSESEEKDHHDHDHGEIDHVHHHDHTDNVDEFLFVSENAFDLEKFNDWVTNHMPKEIIRAKGFIRFEHFLFKTFLFQMVGSRKNLLPFVPRDSEKFDTTRTRIVFLGKNIDKSELSNALSKLIST